MAYCACDEKGHGHGAVCNKKTAWKDTLPMDMYDYEPIYSYSGGKKIKIGEKAIDVDQNRCCPECYQKFLEDAKKNLKKTKFEYLNPL
tara:strand:- start:5088 stop:5351 length:264 start_codon:yes stop_codon:yes gene_type:complete